jgi:hypothetical protein
MADDNQTTVDTAGVTRTADGQIAPPVVRTRSESTSTTETKEQPKPEAKVEAKTEVKEGETLLTDKGKEETKEAPKAPDAYADFKVPDGYTLDPEVTKEAGTIFKELGLSQDGAQKLVDFYVGKTKEAFEAPFKAYTDMRKGWRDKVTADPDIGHRLPQIKTDVTRMLNQHLGQGRADQFREAMDLTGVGDHPAFVWALDKLSQLLTESRSHVPGSKPSPFGQTRDSTPQSAAAAMYPHLPSSSR